MPAAPAPVADEASPTAVLEIDTVRSGPSLPALCALAVALVVISVAATLWWSDRSSSPGAVDIGFYDDMTTHPQQAIDTAHVYMRYGDDDLLRSMAQEIDYSQAGDNRVMQTALQDWGETGSPDVAMEWMGMSVPQNQQPGMATPEQLDALESARGSALDDLFTQLMIDHHAAGAEMAQAAADDAKLDEVRDLAAAMASGQRFEISELNFARRQLGLPEYQPTAHRTRAEPDDTAS